MKADNARILVIGAGVNGSVCASGLHNAGIDVTVLARGTRLETLREKGIVIENPLKNARIVTKVPVIDKLTAEDIYDYVLVVVRKNQVADLLPVLAQNRSPNVAFLVNNPSGPDEWIAALDKNRVMLGFVFAGGKRDGEVIRAISGGSLRTPFGEIDGSVTPRLTRLVDIMRKAGFKAQINPMITDWLATHAALVAPFAVMTMKHHCDLHSLARADDDVRLLAIGMKETLAVLRANGRRITPLGTAIVGLIPNFILVAAIKMFLPTRVAEVGGAWHVSQAPDEMLQLAKELKALVERSGLPVPALRKLLESVESIKESQRIGSTRT